MPDDLDTLVEGHRRRNIQLAEDLLGKGVVLSEPRDIDLHFWAHGHDAAIRLGKRMYDRGYLIIALSPTKTQGVWNVEARTSIRPADVMKDSYVRELAQAAADCGAEFDGWGTLI